MPGVSASGRLRVAEADSSARGWLPVRVVQTDSDSAGGTSRGDSLRDDGSIGGEDRFRSGEQGGGPDGGTSRCVMMVCVTRDCMLLRDTRLHVAA